MSDFFQNILNTIAEFAATFGFKLLGSIIVLVIGIFLIKWLIKFISTRKSFQKIPKNAQILISNLITAALYVVLAVTIALIFDVPAASLVAVLGSAGLAIGLALQGEQIEVQISLFPVFVGDAIPADSLQHLCLQPPDHQLVNILEVVVEGHAVQPAFLRQGAHGDLVEGLFFDQLPEGLQKGFFR